ncbi:MAG: carboxypeptidase-like regulatory domain-containing protein [Candidatus Sericytochromatia bacterium]|nr:carboxypeptidase-like regulatory domain-containing protein [Candidatus Sericytochromatia bacterium]
MKKRPLHVLLSCCLLAGLLGPGLSGCTSTRTTLPGQGAIGSGPGWNPLLNPNQILGEDSSGLAAGAAKAPIVPNKNPAELVPPSPPQMAPVPLASAAPPPAPAAPSADGLAEVSELAGMAPVEVGLTGQVSALPAYLDDPDAWQGADLAKLINEVPELPAAGLAGVAAHEWAPLATPGRQLLALTGQKPLGRAWVRLVDAAGNPIRNQQGKPLVSRTDDQGRYAFRKDLPAGSYRLVVSLGKRGALEALAPRDRAAGDALDIDVVSALSSRFVLREVLAERKNANDLLAQIAASEERELRERIAKLLAADPGLLPDALLADRLRATFLKLRQRDPALGDRFDKLKARLAGAGDPTR